MHCGCTSLPVLLECLPDTQPLGSPQARRKSGQLSPMWPRLCKVVLCTLVPLCCCREAVALSVHLALEEAPEEASVWGVSPSLPHKVPGGSPSASSFAPPHSSLGPSCCHPIYAALSHSPQRGRGSVPLHSKLHRPLELSFSGPMSQESCLFSLM